MKKDKRQIMPKIFVTTLLLLERRPLKYYDVEYKLYRVDTIMVTKRYHFLNKTELDSIEIVAVFLIYLFEKDAEKL